MYNKTVELISYNYTQDDIGQSIETPIYRKVYAEKKSIPQNEFFLCGQNNIKASCIFKVRTGDYKGELKIRYDNTIYAIYRVYDTKNELSELYCEVRIGEQYV